MQQADDGGAAKDEPYVQQPHLLLEVGTGDGPQRAVRMLGGVHVAALDARMVLKAQLQRSETELLVACDRGQHPEGQALDRCTHKHNSQVNRQHNKIAVSG